jgi:hypothetical protein
MDRPFPPGYRARQAFAQRCRQQFHGGSPYAVRNRRAARSAVSKGTVLKRSLRGCANVFKLSEISTCRSHPRCTRLLNSSWTALRLLRSVLVAGIEADAAPLLDGLRKQEDRFDDRGDLLALLLLPAAEILDGDERSFRNTIITVLP